MTTLEDALQRTHQGRNRDPLAPVTFVAPSHAAALQLRRRLARMGPFAGVRFETLPRLAELIGAGALARAGRSPLARPIGDHVAGAVARQSMGSLRDAAALPGYGRVLRQAFRRLRRGGFRHATEVPVTIDSGHLGEVVRLYGLFRAGTARFYDDEDLLDAAAETMTALDSGFAAELGEVYIVPPGPLSAGADRLVRALGRRVTHLEETPARPGQTRLVLAPDPASEAREAVREVIDALDAGARLDDVAVFHGADPAYRGLLADALAAAGVPAAVLPGRPLIETPAGRGVLSLAELPLNDFSRTETLDFLNLAPLRSDLPAGDGRIRPLPSAWLRLARDAGVTHGLDRWQTGLETLATDREEALRSPNDLSEGRIRAYESERDRARELHGFITTLVQRLQPLLTEQPAASFIRGFKAVVREYLRPDAEALPEVEAEIDQLGTIDAVGGRFSLSSFAEALRANLTLAAKRENGLADGVLVADYRMAAGLSLGHVVLCGAYEGAFPSGVAAEALVADETWSRLRERHPFVEDARLRLQRGQEAARRAAAAATRTLTWTAPMRDSSGGSDRYPAALMLEAARSLDASIETASDLRGAAARDWLRRAPSPLAARLRGREIDAAELRLRRSVGERRDGVAIGPGHDLWPAVSLVQARHGARFSAYDGNLHGLERRETLLPRAVASPTALESYATCGFRYFLANVLRLRPVKDPEERDTIDPLQRGSLVHGALEAFYREQQTLGRPRPGEPWTEADVTRLLQITDNLLAAARRRGLTGLDVYAGFDRAEIQADLRAFLAVDSTFRQATGAVPSDFELHIEATAVGEVSVHGFADRIDRTPDGSAAWVIDYKTGSASGYEKASPDDPFAGGTKLQLPVYIFAARGAEQVTALYWFISRRGEFKKVEYTASPENAARFEATLAAINGGLREGAFPAVPGEENDFYGSFDNCRFCDFDRVCSLRRSYEMQEKSSDPDFAGWLRVGQTARNEPAP